MDEPSLEKLTADLRQLTGDAALHRTLAAGGPGPSGSESDAADALARRLDEVLGDRIFQAVEGLGAAQREALSALLAERDQAMDHRIEELAATLRTDRADEKELERQVDAAVRRALEASLRPLLSNIERSQQKTAAMQNELAAASREMQRLSGRPLRPRRQPGLLGPAVYVISLLAAFTLGAAIAPLIVRGLSAMLALAGSF